MKSPRAFRLGLTAIENRRAHHSPCGARPAPAAHADAGRNRLSRSARVKIFDFARISLLVYRLPRGDNRAEMAYEDGYDAGFRKAREMAAEEILKAFLEPRENQELLAEKIRALGD